MDTSRFILVLALSLVMMMLWQAWEQDYGHLSEPQQATPANSSSDTPELGAVEGATAAGITTPEFASTPTPAESAARPSRKILVRTDTLLLEIDPRGGGIVKASLQNYPVEAGGEAPFVLMDNTADLLYITQGGLLSKQGGPTHEELYSVSAYNYTLKDNQDTLEVPLSWTSDTGIHVSKIFEFKRNSHLIRVRYVVENRTASPWQGRSYQQIKRGESGNGQVLIHTYTGAVISSPEERYEKISFEDMLDQTLERDTSDGWAAMLQHYFVSALIPVDKQAVYRYYTKAVADNRYVIGAIAPLTQIEPNQVKQIDEQLYIGPKILEDLETLADGLELTVDYGMLWFIAKPLFFGLKYLHDKTGNWGWAIILVTIVLKLLFFPLSAAGYRSMANMRRVQPRMMAIKDRYKDDKQRLNQAMMQIYKEEKINPLGGCFPILVQIPVFIALYWVLLESVELRQATFILWLQDLSDPDPYFVLPLLMGVTMFIQQKLNPAPMDPVQAKVMTVLPIAFTVFFAFFPSGLVLYWVVNNVLSIAQQWQITRSLERSGISTKS